MTAYDVLGAQPGMDREQLGRRFRERLREVHPDLHPELSRAEERTREVIEAYELLSDPERRAALDGSLRAEAERVERERRRAEEKKEPPRAQPRTKRPGKKRTTRRRTVIRQTNSVGASTHNVVQINGQRIDLGPGQSLHLDLDIDGSRVVVQSNSARVSSGSASLGSSGGRWPLGDRRVNGGRVEGAVLGDLHVTGGRVQLLGQVLGDVFVTPGAELHVSGQVIGDLHLQGSKLVVTGSIIGDIHTQGGSVDLRGQHVGRLR